MEATIESVFQQEGALCQPVASNHAKVTKLPRACCLGPNLHVREGAQGLVTSGQTHWLFPLQPVPLCTHLSGSLPFCSPWGQSGKWAISTVTLTGHITQRASVYRIPVESAVQGFTFRYLLLHLPWGSPVTLHFRLSNMVTSSLISRGSAPNPAAEILWPSGLDSLPAIMTVLSFQIMLLASSRFLN